MEPVNIADLRVYRYSLKFRHPINIHNQALDRREGYILSVRSDEQIEGLGEAAPLPGLSMESFAQAGDQLRNLRMQCRGWKIPDHLTAFNGKFERWLGPLDLKPSVRFGLESAILHLLANAQKSPIRKLIPMTTGGAIRVSGLISATSGDVGAQTKALIKGGASELKLKVGGHPDEDAANVKTVNAICGGKALLHVDANQRWSYAQAVSFGRSIGCGSVSYIEEPFKEIERIPEFYDETMIPIALDESLTHVPFEQIRGISGVETIIIKPTILGGIEKTVQLIAKAGNCAMCTVISSAYESSLGIWTLANIAAAVPSNGASGLDTLKYFTEDIFLEPICFRRGEISISDRALQPSNINFNLLCEIK